MDNLDGAQGTEQTNQEGSAQDAKGEPLSQEQLQKLLSRLALRKTISIGPFSVFFSNVNSAMGLKGHSHFACLKLTYQTTGKRGFPAFADTYAAIQAELQAMTARPFRDHSNEDVADYLFERFANFDYAGHPVFAKWDGDYRLIKIRLAVRGVPDAIGHADGFTTYTVGYDF